jgi:formate hydrogenlyase transcriptional activator
LAFLDFLVAENQFRSDLYCRLNVFPICIPPLRERHEDIPPLMHHFAKHSLGG